MFVPFNYLQYTFPFPIQYLNSLWWASQTHMEDGIGILCQANRFWYINSSLIKPYKLNTVRHKSYTNKMQEKKSNQIET